jgi:hypothetical protein
VQENIPENESLFQVSRKGKPSESARNRQNLVASPVACW